MPIAFPRALPTELPVAGLQFYLDPMIERTPLRSGRQIALDLGPSLWRGKWESSEVDEARYEALSAWYATLLSSREFLGWPALREYPRAYAGGFGGLTVGGSPFSGDCTLTSVAGNAVEISLSALPAGFVFSTGDMLAFDYGAGNVSRALHKIVADATASGAGTVTVEVRPDVRVGWQAGAAVHLYRPAARMIILPGTWSESLAPGPIGRVSFEAIQTL